MDQDKKQTGLHFAKRLLLAIVGLGLGITAGFLLVVSAATAVAALLDPGQEFFHVIWALPATIVAFYAVVWSARLILGKPRRDGRLISPRWFLGLLLFLAAMAPLSLLTGAY